MIIGPLRYYEIMWLMLLFMLATVFLNTSYACILDVHKCRSLIFGVGVEVFIFHSSST
jgi:hypothetical protein